MPSALPVMGEVAGSATALAGLILVFLGAISTSFDSYAKPERASVLTRYQRRVWFAFVGFTLALASAFMALVAKWLTIECAAIASLVLLFVALIWVLFVALSDVREIK
ncbi:hypothetical protein NKH37_23860 [Mesorhizobium sp. M1217]|uniref:hypothetical protein n=1 Tax=Mesorhizobium sp. M1217 TaxID=2957070 RepID=UPI00333901A5